MIWQALVGRAEGPLAFRLVLQPVVAALLALRAGRRDAHDGRAPFFFSVISDPAQRGYLLHEGWRDLSKVFVLAVVMDLVYQWLVFPRIYPLRALLVAAVLAVVPYCLLRGVTCRLVRTRA